MKVTRKAIAQVVETLLFSNCRRATVYFDEHTVVSACLRRPVRRSDKTTDIVLKLGKPNFVERRFIRMCKRVGEPLPVRKVQIKHWPKKGGAK